MSKACTSAAGASGILRVTHFPPESDTFSSYMFKTTSLFAAANVYLCILNREIVELSSRRKEYSA